MTDRDDPFEGPDEGHPRRRPGWGAWILLGISLPVAATVGVGAGYGLARGAWEIPDSVATRLPGAVTARLSPGFPAQPAILKGYAFELLDAEAKTGEARLMVRLLDKRTGKPVAGALIYTRRLDMAPAGMPAMTGKLSPEGSPEPGVYAFRANLAMEGRWRLSLAAKVPGETGTVQDQLVLKAVE